MAEPEGQRQEEAVDLDLAGPGQPRSLEGYSPPTKPWDPVQHKAKSATWVALVILMSFAGTILLVLVTIGVIVAVTTEPESAKRLADTLVSVLDSLGNFLTAVFAPLLAFVLGYYFSEKQKDRE